jgi:squalene synthase HpnC
MSIEHYENFPVASILLPAQLRPAVEAIYAFARSADDIADEGDACPDDRLAELAEYELALDQIALGQATQSALFQRLASVIHDYALPLKPFRDLLSAFKQDVVTTRYADFSALDHYCQRSANPVGILMLHLYKAATERNLADSNAICTALQIINFWQDVAVDWQKDRIYLPLEDLARFGVSEENIAKQSINDNWRALMQFEINRARTMMLSGAHLALRLPGRIGWELRLVVQGGLRILERIEEVDYDVFQRRPKLGKRDWVILVWRAMWM